VPRFVEREFRAYLACGVLAHGFLRLHCDACGCDRLVPFACKGRGFCPAWGGRRMADNAAHLVDRVLPEVPVRQWVLSLPFQLRYRLAYDAPLTSQVLSGFLRALFASLRRRARMQWGVHRGQCGPVTFVQRFGSALNLNLHFHTLAFDGVFEVAAGGTPRFHPLPPPDEAEVARVVAPTARRLARVLESRGLGPHSDLVDSDPLARDEPLLAALAAASLQGRVATGPRTGQRLLRLGDRGKPEDRDPDDSPTPRCASAGGLSLHADVAVSVRDRKRLERLCRYVARPPLATERLTRLDDGRLCYRLETRWRDGTTHIVLEPRDLLEHLAALVPPPRFHTVRYHGILAPCASWRDYDVPAEPAPPVAAATAGGARTHAWGTTTGRAGVSQPEPARAGTRTNAAAGGSRPSRLDNGTASEDAAAPGAIPSASGARWTHPRRLPWADLLQRVFAIDALACPRGGGRLKLLAVIESPEAIRAILDCLGFPSRAPPLAPAEPEATPFEPEFQDIPAFVG
jgi:hypothetical protein